MMTTLFDISRYFLNQRQNPVRISSRGGRTVFWRTTFLDEDQAASLLDQWRLQAPGLERLFGDQKRYVFPQLELAIEGRTFIPKVYRLRKLSQNLIALAFAEAERNCATQSYLYDRNIRVPMPAGVLNTYKSGWLTESIFFQEKLTESIFFQEKLPASCVAYKKFLPAVRDLLPESRNTFFVQLAHEIARLHSLGVYTEDTDQNMFVEHMPDASFRFHFFDFDNFYPWRYPTLRRTAHAIRHYTNSKLYPESVNKCCQRCWLEISTLFFENPGDFRPENFQLKDNCRFASSENRLFAVFRRTTPRNAA